MPFEMKYGSLSYIFSLSQFEEMMKTEEKEAPEENRKKRKTSFKICKKFIKQSVTCAGKSE